MKNIAMIFTLVFILVSCASTTWDNMSESDISTWKELGVSMEDANEMNEEGIYAKDLVNGKPLVSQILIQSLFNKIANDKSVIDARD